MSWQSCGWRVLFLYSLLFGVAISDQNDQPERNRLNVGLIFGEIDLEDGMPLYYAVQI